MSGIAKIAQAKRLLQEAAQDQNCSMCKSELETIVNATEQSEIKLRSMTEMVDQMASRGIIDADEKLQSRFAPTKAITRFNDITGGDGLGVSDIAQDVAGIVDDMKELRQITELLPELPQTIMEQLPEPSAAVNAIIVKIKPLKMPPFPKLPQIGE